MCSDDCGGVSACADHLEEIVEERTLQLAEEQRRTEELLCRMLPQSVAAVSFLSCDTLVDIETLCVLAYERMAL